MGSMSYPSTGVTSNGPWKPVLVVAGGGGLGERNVAVV